MTDWFPPSSKPLPVEGGLKARSRRGAIARTWWSGRFVAVLESLGVGGRMERGRRYARRGQVIDLDLAAGAVTARVQGSRAEPYRVRVGLPAFAADQWDQVTQALADDAWYAARLLAGDMPDDIEDVFAGVGLSLFPVDGELSMGCTCPDWGVPCKHVAAVFYLLAESFDDDPFGILAWRGRDRDALLEAVSERRGAGAATDRAAVPGAATPLDACLDAFFAPPAGAEAGPGAETAPPVPPPAPRPVQGDALLDQLPAVDVAVRGVPLVDALRPAYRALAGDGGHGR